MKFLCTALIFIGIILLALSLFCTKKICEKNNRICMGWKFLSSLIILFIAGYMAYGLMMKDAALSVDKIIISLILFGGAIFVITVVRLSNITIDHMDLLAQKERHRATHDELTELPNRTLFQERLDSTLAMCRRHREPLAILMMDLVRFKEINDSLGHFYGDYLLQEVAHRLSRVFRRESDTLARLGGDEFGVLLRSGEEEAIRMCQHIAEIIDQPFMIEGHNLNVGISIGIAIFPEHGQDSETLIQHADIAMYEAKRNEVVYSVFDAEQDRSTWNRLIMVGQLRDAVKRKQFVLHYQPKVALQQKEPCSLEALIRWQHPQEKYIYPNDFIPLVEQAGLSKTLTLWVLSEAMGQIKKWSRESVSLTVSVNLSIKNLHDLDFPATVRKLLDKFGLDPSQLCLELTESSMVMDQERVFKVVHMLRDLDIRLSMDDFGTGYSSIAYLRKFPVQEIKIDKSLVRDILDNEDSKAIVQSTIDLAHSIDCCVVAEGVENEQVLRQLTQMGCDMIQGFYVCRPLPANELVTWLRQTSWCKPQS
ncbi:EAL domain-containing protein [Desulfolithobacter sp.]